MTQADFRIIEPCAAVRGTVGVPGDKSISHRLAMLCALADGKSRVEGFLFSEDCVNTLRAAEQLGAEVERDGSAVIIEGTGGRFRTPPATLDLGNSGTGMRLLAGLLAGQAFATELTGDSSLCSRPMGRIKEPLELMGAKVDLLGKRGCAPMRITGSPLHGIEYVLPMASAQVKSCVMLAGLLARGETMVVEPKPTRDHTERLLRAMGIPVVTDGLRVMVRGCGADGPQLAGRHWPVPGDFSSAAYWMTAAACRDGSEITLENVGLNPRRTAFLDVLRRMGAEIEIQAGPTRHGDEVGWEPAGSIRVKGTKLRGTEVAGEEIPAMIDELPLVAVAGAIAEGRTVIRDAGELRVKESDRISAMADGLTALGVAVEEQPGGMVVTGSGTIRGGAEVASKGDHRVAMAMAILSLFADGPVRVSDVSCVLTSYPGFWGTLKETVA